MSTNTSNQFLANLTKYLQDLCHRYVKYEQFVMVTGNLYLTVDAEVSSIVVSEKLSKTSKTDGYDVNFSTKSFYSMGEINEGSESGLPISFVELKETSRNSNWHNISILSDKDSTLSKDESRFSSSYINQDLIMDQDACTPDNGAEGIYIIIYNLLYNG